MGKSSLLSLGVILVDGGVCPQMDPQRLIESEGEKIYVSFLPVGFPCPVSTHRASILGLQKLQMFLGSLGDLDVTALSDLSTSHSPWFLPVKSVVIFCVSVLLFELTWSAIS